MYIIFFMSVCFFVSLGFYIPLENIYINLGTEKLFFEKYKVDRYNDTLLMQRNMDLHIFVWYSNQFF